MNHMPTPGIDLTVRVIKALDAEKM